MSKLRIMIKWISLGFMPNFVIYFYLVYYFYCIHVNAGGSPWQRIIGN